MHQRTVEFAAVPAVQRGTAMGMLATLLAFSILFLGGYNMALPVADEGVAIPIYFQPVQIVYGVFLKEFLLMLYLAAAVVSGALGKIRLGGDVKRFALLVAGLGYAGIYSSVMNQTSVFDIGQSLRLVLLSAHFFVMVHWALSLGTTFVLRSFLTGIVLGGAINLYYTFQVQFMTIGILPFLLGQNGPGGSLGLSVGLGAWLMLLRRQRTDAIVAILVALLGLFAASISYSKLSMLMALCGLGGWIAVFASSVRTQGSLRVGLSLTVIVVTTTVLLGVTSIGQEYVESVGGFLFNKFGVLELSKASPDGGRYMYLWGVSEILASHPLTGVGYSGFYDAITNTDTYKTGLMVPEYFEAGRARQSNPHNAFLYYIAANGIIGLCLVTAIFVLFVRALRRSLKTYGGSGIAVWACLSLAFLVHAMTLPTLYNTEVMYLPAAVAFAISSSLSIVVSGTAPAMVGSARQTALLRSPRVGWPIHDAHTRVR